MRGERWPETLQNGYPGLGLRVGDIFPHQRVETSVQLGREGRVSGGEHDAGKTRASIINYLHYDQRYPSS